MKGFHLGTSEKILETKRSLFDIFVDERSLNAVNQENQKNLLHITSNDKKRFELLMKKFRYFYKSFEYNS